MNKKFFAIIVLAVAVLVVGALFAEGKFKKEEPVRIIENSSSTLWDGDVCVYQDGDLYGLADSEGNVIAKAQWARIEAFMNGYAVAAMSDGEFEDFSGEPVGSVEWGVIDSVGNTVIDYQFDYLEFSDDGEILAAQRDSRYGYINLKGEILVPFEYEYAYPFENGYARVGYQAEPDAGLSDAGRIYWGMIDTSGKTVIPMEYDSITYHESDGSFSAVTDGKTKYYTLNEEKLESIETVSGDILLEDYMPFDGEKVVQLDEAPTLQNWVAQGEKYPRLDGATALFPVYSAFVQAVYPETTRYQSIEESADPILTCTKTARAYSRLIDGEADLIFVAEPSDAQLQEAAENGVELELTPFGKEAFVFIVNEDNPLQSITVEEIRDVYSGQTTQWEELGAAELGEIIAYQRPKNSGSQTALEKLMGDTQIMAAPTERISDGMGDIVENIEYRNYPDAIGYSFRFYCTQMLESRVKLLKIDGIEASVENIRSGAYPITSTLYMVTRKGDVSESTQKFMAWVLSDQGAELIEKAGYVPLK